MTNMKPAIIARNVSIGSVIKPFSGELGIMDAEGEVTVSVGKVVTTLGIGEGVVVTTLGLGEEVEPF
jgi:hypothetical protein